LMKKTLMEIVGAVYVDLLTFACHTKLRTAVIYSVITVLSQSCRKPKKRMMFASARNADNKSLKLNHIL